KEREVAWKLTDKHITELEEQIDEWSKVLPPITQFILPSGHRAATTLHFARTVVRRAERAAVAVQDELAHPLPVSYLNRLSDFLFRRRRDYIAGRCVRQENKNVYNVCLNNGKLLKNKRILAVVSIWIDFYLIYHVHY